MTVQLLPALDPAKQTKKFIVALPVLNVPEKELVESVLEFAPYLSAKRAKSLIREEINRRQVATGSFNAKELMGTNPPKREPVVDGIIYRGDLVQSTGRPKSGKSLKALGVSIDVATGSKALGCLDTSSGDVLYCALEDGPWRIRTRIRKMLGGRNPPEKLHFLTNLNRLDAGGIAQLESWTEAHPDAVLIVIDTFVAVRPKPKGRSSGLYQDDYQSMAPLQTFAQGHNLGVLAIHHRNKRELASTDDWLDLVSGTTGLTAACDGIWLLDKPRGRADGILRITGRDIREQELALSFDASSLKWTVAGQAVDFTRSVTRQEIIDALKKAGKPLGPKKVAELSGKNYNTTRRLMKSMLEDGELTKLDRGKYVIPPEQPEH